MAFLADLWLPIVVSAVFVFFVSSILHMVVPMHKGDYKKLPGEEAIRDAIRAERAPPGQYMFPSCASMKDMGSPEMIAKFEAGPVGTMILLPPGPPAIGKNLIQWFLYSLAVGVFVAYLASAYVAPGAEYLHVFRITGTAAFLAYGLSTVPESIWKGVSWGVTVKFLIDGLLYALATAGTFAWLWPS